MVKLKVEAASAAKLLQRIRSLKRTVEITTKKLHRQKIELWLNTYLYCETVEGKEKWSRGEAYAELVETVGGNSGYWGRARSIGQFIRTHRLDCEEVWCSSLSKVGCRIINPKDFPRIRKALEDGMGPSQFDRLLCELGYKAFPKLPAWNKKMIRRAKKQWEDWEPEMRQLVAGIGATHDKSPSIELVLKVSGKEVVSVKAR